VFTSPYLHAGGKDKVVVAPKEEQVTSIFIPSIEAAVQVSGARRLLLNAAAAANS